jgi:hypothetical protein
MRKRERERTSPLTDRPGTDSTGNAAGHTGHQKKGKTVRGWAATRWVGLLLAAVASGAKHRPLSAAFALKHGGEHD